MLPTRILRVAAVTFVAAIVACGDVTRPKATSANLLIEYSLYPLTGSPASVTNAVSFFGGPTRADATFSFDVAFDVDSSGKVVLYPVRSLAGTLAGPLGTHVGLQTVPGSFEALREAPETGYDTISVKRVSPGQVVAVQLVDQSGGQCFYSLGGQQTYAKFVVDSVNASRRIFLRSVVDLNCGYRSLVPDEIPTN